MNPREEFEKETGLTTGIMLAHAVGFRHKYVLWLEAKLQQPISEDAIMNIIIKYNQCDDWWDFKDRHPELFIEKGESHSDQIIDIMNSEKSCANCDKLPTCRENERTEACNAWKPITHNHATK